jgi:hypothetical protein
MTQSTSVTSPAASGDETIPQAAGEDGMAALPTRRATGDWRDQLGSRRWDPAPLRNPEVEKTDPRIAVAFIVGLAALTLAIIVIGYASGFWVLPSA